MLSILLCLPLIAVVYLADLATDLCRRWKGRDVGDGLS